MEREAEGAVITFAIVEDEGIEREAMSLFIRESFPQVQVCWTAQDGEEGLQKVEFQRPDILIVDIEMPVMNGLQMCEALYRRNYDGVVLIHTAYAKFSYARQAVALNAFDYILKPMDDEELRQTLARCIQEAGRRREARRQMAQQEQVVQDVKQYVLSLLTLDTMDDRQRELFFQTVGWPRGQALQTWVVLISSGTIFDPGKIRYLSEETAWLREHGFLLSGEYLDSRRYLLLLQPAHQMEPARLYSLVELFLAFLTEGSAKLGAAALGPCGDFPDIARDCRALSERKVGEVAGSAGPGMPGRTWRTIPIRQMEKISGNLNRYLRDGDGIRARRYLERLCGEEPEQERARYWELVPALRAVMAGIAGGQEGTEDSFRVFFSDTDEAPVWPEQLFAGFSPEKRQGEGDALAHVLEWMRMNFAQEVSLQTAARKMGMDSAYFSRYFKKQTGRNYSDMLTQFRLEHCVELLREDPEMSLEELAGACGFHSKSYFCEVFKRWQGMTVSQYVKQQQTEAGSLPGTPPEPNS